jgi:hypothetical protein
MALLGWKVSGSFLFVMMITNISLLVSYHDTLYNTSALDLS